MRRMSNTTERLGQEDRDKIMNRFADKLRQSGYNRIQAREIITSGLKGYESRRRREMEGGVPIHRMKHSTQRGRDLRKMLTKNNWFKNKPTSQGVPHARGAGGAGGGGGGGARGGGGASQTNTPRPTPVTVLFIPRTPEGRLIKNLREIEQKLSTVNQKTLRLV